MKQIFRRLYKPCELWFPFPIVLDKDICDPMKRRLLYGLEEENYVHGGHDLKSFAELVDELVVAANAAEAWVLETRQVKHFLGFYEDALQPTVPLGRYGRVLYHAKKNLCSEKLRQLSLWPTMQSDEYTVRVQVVSFTWE